MSDDPRCFCIICRENGCPLSDDRRISADSNPSTTNCTTDELVASCLVSFALSFGASQVLPPHYSGGDSHLAVVSKRLAKRDVTTKIKALAELRAMCR